MKQISIIILAFLISNTFYSQDRQSRREQIKTLKIAYITEKIDLSQAEAQKFWPIYNRYEEDSETFRKDLRGIRSSYNMESLTEEDAKSLLKKISDLELKRLNLKNDYTEQLLNAISAKKIILLKEAEESFNRRMIREFKNRRLERRDKQ